VLFRRAILSARTGDPAGAARFIAGGQSAAAAIEDDSARKNAIADLDFAEGIVFASSEPQRALVALTRAVGVREESRRMLLPATLFERARVLRSLGRTDDARADLESAVEAVEAQRKPVEWRDTSSGALEGIDGIYTALAELLLERGRNREAFVTADRAAAHAFYGADATDSVTSIEALQQRLAPGTIVVEYLVLPRRTIIFFVDANTFEMREAAVAQDELARLFSDLDTALRGRAAIARVQDASLRLHKILIAPVRDLLGPGTSITVVPDPLIASLPCAALFDAASGRWLIEDHAIRIVPSALYKSDAPHEPATRVVVIRPSGGVDLPKAAAEVAAIMGIYPRAALIEGSSATAASVLESIRDADVIHYAGHASNEGDGALLLRAGGERAEMLYGADVALTPLRGRPLVVLAGCRTLRGGSRREDLATSLARAFLLAGARSVVGTMWDIDDDAAATFFTRFHQMSSATADPAGALCDAQRSMLRERRHPSDWAFPQIVVRAIES
jgi:CHAT domain-containing protein